MGHYPGRYFPPEDGGLVFNGDVGNERLPDRPRFRRSADHRAAYQKGRTVLGRMDWRYDSGLVAGAVGSLDDASGLTGAAAVGNRFSFAGPQADHLVRRRYAGSMHSPSPTITGDATGDFRRRAPRMTIHKSARIAFA